MTSSSGSTARVFVSSTCYDLIDLRASLEVVLREAGLSPFLSDRPTSDFANPGDKNSIETCLVNLRSCERCIVVLSQRYGTSLKAAGFDDVSATHLEYREARRARIPIIFYARDRLLAEFNLWRKNKSLATVWAHKDDALKLFEFLIEHAALENSDKPNWVWPFSSATDLASRVLADLGSTATEALVRKLAEQGRLPQFSLRCDQDVTPKRDAVLENVRSVRALRVGARDPLGKAVLQPTDMEPGQKLAVRFDCGSDVLSMRGGHTPVIRVDYETPTGERLCDLFAILPGGSGWLRTVPAGRQFVGRSLRVTSPAIVEVGAYAMIPLQPINSAFENHSL